MFKPNFIFHYIIRSFTGQFVKTLKECELNGVLDSVSDETMFYLLLGF